MKALLDMSVSPLLKQVLARHGYTGVHANEIGKQRASDADLLDDAHRERQVVITADLDFPRLLALTSAHGPGLILFRGGNYSDHEMCELLDSVLHRIQVSVLETSICVIDHRRMRIRPLPIA